MPSMSQCGVYLGDLRSGKRDASSGSGTRWRRRSVKTERYGKKEETVLRKRGEDRTVEGEQEAASIVDH